MQFVIKAITATHLKKNTGTEKPEYARVEHEYQTHINIISKELTFT